MAFSMNLGHKLYATQPKQQTQTQTHPLHNLIAHSNASRNMKATHLHSNSHTNIIISNPDITPEKCKKLEHICTIIILQYLSFRKNKSY